MWGFKKEKNKKETKLSHSKRFTSDSFVIHTMQDDIDEKFLKKATEVVKKNANPDSSPFLAENLDDKKVKKSIFSFKKKDTEKEIDVLPKEVEDIKPKIENTIEKPESKINFKTALDEEVHNESNLQKKNETVQNFDKKEESFFGDSSIEDDYRIDVPQKTKLGTGNLNQEVVNDSIDNTTFETLQEKKKDNTTFKVLQDKKIDEKVIKKQILPEKKIEKPLYDARKEYEDSLASANDNLPNFTNTSQPYFPYESNNKQTDSKINYSNKKASSSFLKFFIVLFLVMLSLGGVIGWFLFSGKSDTIINLLNRVGIEIEIPTKDSVVNVQNEKENDPDENNNPKSKTNTYSTTSANYIKIKSTSSAVSDFSENLKEISKTLEKENNYNLIPFSVVTEDKKNLSFRAFATMINLTLPEKALLNVGNDFTIYAYRSPATLVTRFSIVVNSLDEVALKKAFRESEGRLVSDLKPLFIEILPLRSDIKFKDSQYGPHNIRFFNFEDGTNKSVDYIIEDKKLIISTSMETMRFLMDAVLK